jgi:hypothetical protein
MQNIPERYADWKESCRRIRSLVVGVATSLSHRSNFSSTFRYSITSSVKTVIELNNKVQLISRLSN